MSAGLGHLAGTAIFAAILIILLPQGAGGHPGAREGEASGVG